MYDYTLRPASRLQMLHALIHPTCTTAQGPALLRMPTAATLHAVNKANNNHMKNTSKQRTPCKGELQQQVRRGKRHPQEERQQNKSTIQVSITTG